MTTEKISVVTEVSASPEDVYDAWLDSKRHSAMTGGRAEIAARVGGRHTAWDGYIEGQIVDLQAGLRIAKLWRTREFPVDAPDSHVEITFLPVAGGTRVAVFHTEIPEGQGQRYELGWEQHYFAPMRAYFRKRSRVSEKEAKTKSVRRKPPSGRRKAKPRTKPKAARKPKARASKKPVRQRVKSGRAAKTRRKRRK